MAVWPEGSYVQLLIRALAQALTEYLGIFGRMYIITVGFVSLLPLSRLPRGCPVNLWFMVMQSGLWHITLRSTLKS